MAKITWNDTGADGFGGNLVLSINSNHTKAVFVDEENGGQIILFGEDLKGQGGNLDSGDIDKVVFKDGDGNQIIVATDGKFKTSAIAAATAEDDAFGVYLSLFTGDDTVTGSNGNDSLVGLRGDDELFGGKGMDSLQGGKGDDEITGGLGQDSFYFENNGVQHDIIHDLDVLGEVTDQLIIDAEVTKVKGVHDGHDTLLTLDNGSTILLEDVKKADFLDYMLPS
ncbi:calcium-binding protein [Rhizobium sp. LjRoot254]|uniref:calcium-binding protein n=1 Tax=Rhizobium sp. LjRoot254 TaxID=3342297 RepID=UPI003ECEA77F